MQTITGYKILSHNWRAPLQGGQAVCDGILPVTLPAVALDRSDADCGAGWNFCGSLTDAAKIAGYWRDGH